MNQWRQVKNKEVLQTEAPEIFLANGAKFKKSTFWSKRHSQQMQILSVGVMEKIFIEKHSENQKNNKDFYLLAALVYIR